MVKELDFFINSLHAEGIDTTKILNDLNKDDVSLENSIKLHEQGKKLLNEAREILENAKLSIKQVDDE